MWLPEIKAGRAVKGLGVRVPCPGGELPGRAAGPPGRSRRGPSLRKLVIPREGGGSSTPRLLGSITAVSGILDRPPSRTMTVEYEAAISRRWSPEVCISFALSIIEGAGKTGCLLHPRSRVRFALTKTAHEHTGQREHSGLPCAMALRLTSCSSRRTALLPPSPPRNLLLENLTPAPRRPNHTTSPYASRPLACARSHVHRISPRVRDDGQRPSSAVRRAELCR